LGIKFFDDYAHHPTEIKATLQAFREKFTDNKITVVFMPHLYSRTKILFDEFTRCFDDASEVLLLPIFAAREKFDPSVSSDSLAIEIANVNPKLNVVSFKNMETLVDYLHIHNSSDKIVITMGAGDVYKIYDLLN
jgi:UDP-N-acetylmuramate--alanine ligase